MSDQDSDDDPQLPKPGKGAIIGRGTLNIASAIPFVGGVFSAAAGAWSEREQSRINAFIEQWLKMQAAAMREMEQTILEIAARIDMNDEETARRVESPEYQALLRKAFRDWAGAESEQKRVFIRNLLTNAAATRVQSDDVVNLFLQWIKNYSELHFAVIAQIYNNAGVTRGGVWAQLGKGQVRDDSADADLFKLLFRDLTMGGIIRQHRETDHAGHFIAKSTIGRPRSPKGAPRTMKSAFDEDEAYELTRLGQDFVHYVMTEVPPKLEFHMAEPDEQSEP